MLHKIATGHGRKKTQRASGALARLVRSARGPTSQQKFSAQLGVSQESLSRYERGRVKPSTDVVAKCWEVIEGRRDVAPPPAEELAERLHGVGGSEHVAVREVIARLIDISLGTGRSGRRPR